MTKSDNVTVSVSSFTRVMKAAMKHFQSIQQPTEPSTLPSTEESKQHKNDDHLQEGDEYRGHQFSPTSPSFTTSPPLTPPQPTVTSPSHIASSMLQLVISEIRVQVLQLGPPEGV